MKYILTLVFLLIGVSAGAQNLDSLRAARMQQIQRMIEEQQAGGAATGQTPPPGNSGQRPQTANPPANQPRTASPANPSQTAVPAQTAPPARPPRGGEQAPDMQTLIQAARAGQMPQGATAQQPVSERERLEAARRKLDALEEVDANYAREVDELSVAGLPLSELLRNIAKVYAVNISVKGAEGVKVTCNFSRAKITDLVYFLCKEYNLDVDVVGNIVSVFPVPPPQPAPKVINVAAGAMPGTISYDLMGDALGDVMRQVTTVGRVNFIIPNALNSRLLSGHGQDMAIDEAVVAIASANSLTARRNKNGIWEIADATTEGGSSYRRQSAFNEDQLYIDSLGMITARIARGNVQEIITDLCERQGLNYFFITPTSHTIPLNVAQVTFETLLGVMFTGTEYGYYCEDGIYLFGTFNKETLNSVRVIPLCYRSVSKIEEIIPQQLKEGLELKAFPDLNSIIASGDQRKVQRVENFLRSIDKRVPLVTIEVIIADVTKTDLFEAGIGMGIGEAPVTTKGTMSPGIDLSLGASSVNNLIGKFNGFGSINLGRVTPQFYLNLKFMEENGTIQMHSTPRLSTLNGNPAKLTSGEKSYYKEVQTNYWGSQTPTPSESYVWKEVEANLEINITPYVSEDKLITLEITIVQSEFMDRVEKDGPLGIASRSFESIIRVQNEEMVLLGGIDRNSKTIGASGLPWIAKIPVIKWFFGKETRKKVEQKLNVFIKPTVID
ncbi:type II secretion system protein GspD [Alistipes sp. OttesenSCG-928-B03]|nr:type II secretion system protein GspD [Alistipes sp. OttesenSCG-928-B03]